MRLIPVSPTNIWCASSVSMNRQVRATGSKPGSPRAPRWNFPSRVGKEGGDVKGEPVRRWLVESAENARVIGISGPPCEQGFGFLAAIASEVAMQQVHHGPKVTPFFDVHLENVSQIVHRRTRSPQHPLL